MGGRTNHENKGKKVYSIDDERKKERRRRKEAVKACEMYKTYKVV